MSLYVSFEWQNTSISMYEYIIAIMDTFRKFKIHLCRQNLWKCKKHTSRIELCPRRKIHIDHLSKLSSLNIHITFSLHHTRSVHLLILSAISESDTSASISKSDTSFDYFGLLNFRWGFSSPIINRYNFLKTCETSPYN